MTLLRHVVIDCRAFRLASLALITQREIECFVTFVCSLRNSANLSHYCVKISLRICATLQQFCSARQILGTPYTSVEFTCKELNKLSSVRSYHGEQCLSVIIWLRSAHCGSGLRIITARNRWSCWGVYLSRSWEQSFCFLKADTHAVLPFNLNFVTLTLSILLIRKIQLKYSYNLDVRQSYSGPWNTNEYPGMSHDAHSQGTIANKETNYFSRSKHLSAYSLKGWHSPVPNLYYEEHRNRDGQYKHQRQAGVHNNQQLWNESAKGILQFD